MPNRLSNAVKAARGTLRPSRQKQVPAGWRLTEAPRPPAGLDDAAAREWVELAGILVETGVLTRADTRLLRLLCELLADIGRTAATIDREGLTVTSKSGAVKAHPAMNALAQARAQAARLFETFGLSPRSRSAVDHAPDALDDDDPAAEYFR